MASKIPKLDSERVRGNKGKIPAEKINVRELIDQEYEIPLARESWHPIATLMWESIKHSLFVTMWEPADWATAYMLCESLSRDLKPQYVGYNEITGKANIMTLPLKGAALSAYTRLMGSLCMLEGDRRKMRVELERHRDKPAVPEGSDVNVVAITRNRAAALSG